MLLSLCVYWNYAFSQNKLMVFISPRWELGCWGSSLPIVSGLCLFSQQVITCIFVVQCTSSASQHKYSFTIAVNKHFPDLLFAFWCFWSIKCLCWWIFFFPSPLLYVWKAFIPWDQLLFTYPPPRLPLLFTHVFKASGPVLSTWADNSLSRQDFSDTT